MSEEMRSCVECGESKPLNEHYFGHTPNGNFRRKCRECHNIKSKEWAGNNPDAIRVRWEDQNEQRSRAGILWAIEDKDKIRASLKDQCFYCGTNLNGSGEVDHMLSLGRGGTNERSNLTLACMPCNRAKGSRSAEEYLQYRQSLGLPIRKKK